MFDEKDKQNLVTGITLLAESLQETDSEDILFSMYSKASKDDPTLLNTTVSRYGNPALIAGIIVQSEDEHMRSIAEGVFSMMLYKYMSENKILAYTINPEDKDKLENQEKWNKKLQAQESESLKPRSWGWITKLKQMLRISKR